MLLQANYGYWLTQSAEVAEGERVFLLSVNVGNENIADWKEVSNEEKMAMGRIVDVSNINAASLDSVERLMEKISEGINAAPLSTEEAIAKRKFFPKFEDVVGKEVNIGYRFQYGETLYEVIQAHTMQADWTPDVAVALFKVVQVESAGTEDDVIEWEQGMVLENGKFYMDNGVKYECIRDSGNPLYYELADLVSGGFVKVAE